MAQRTIHYLFGEMISQQIELADKERFLLGSILPDEIAPWDRNKSHFKVETDAFKFFDFEAYRNLYFERMLHDDLYLGYYMHLVEDAFYRAMFYQERFTMPRNKAEVALLHNDYHILNAYIVKKYHIRNILGKNVTLAQEPIGNIAAFLIDEFLDEMSYDFTEQTEGKTVFLTENMLDEFVESYVPLAIEEVKNLKKGASVLHARDYTWPSKR